MNNKQKLDVMYAEVKAWGDQESLRHHMDLGGMYAREVRLKAGEVACMHVHGYDHLSLYVGHIRLMTDDGEDELIGAGTIFIAKDKRHSVLAVSDTLWICAHRADVVEDLEVVEVEHA